MFPENELRNPLYLDFDRIGNFYSGIKEGMNRIHSHATGLLERLPPKVEYYASFAIYAVGATPLAYDTITHLNQSVPALPLLYEGFIFLGATVIATRMMGRAVKRQRA